VEEKGQHWLLVKPLKEGLPCWLLFADKDGKVQDVLMLEHEPPAKEKPKGLTIDEAVKAKPGGTVTVVFEVTAARSGVSPGISLKEHRFVIIEPKGVLKDGGTFRVCISGPAVVPLFTLGLVDERVDGGDSFFKGKTVRVTGILDSRESAVKAGTNDYRLSVFDPGRTHYRSYDVP
jgi:hypothetical protein